MELQSVVHDLKTDVGGKPLGHGGKQGGLRCTAFEGQRRPMHHQPCSIQFGGHVGEAELERLELGDWLAKGLALEHVGACSLQAGACSSKRACTDIDAPSIQALHGDGKSIALYSKPRLLGNFYAVELHHGGGLAAPTELALWLAEGETRLGL